MCPRPHATFVAKCCGTGAPAWRLACSPSTRTLPAIRTGPPLPRAFHETLKEEGLAHRPAAALPLFHRPIQRPHGQGGLRIVRTLQGRGLQGRGPHDARPAQRRPRARSGAIHRTRRPRATAPSLAAASAHTRLRLLLPTSRSCSPTRRSVRTASSSTRRSSSEGPVRGRRASHRTLVPSVR